MLFRLLAAFLPRDLHTIAEVIEDMAILDAAAGREETADDAGDVTPDVELVRIIHADALHAKAESANAWEDNCLSFGQPMLQDVLKFGDYHHNRSLGTSAVPAGFLGNFINRDLALTDGLGEIFVHRGQTWVKTIKHQRDKQIKFVYLADI